jgi:hypothetical protein
MEGSLAPPNSLLSWLWLRHLSPRRRRPFGRGFFFVLRTAAALTTRFTLAGKVDLHAGVIATNSGIKDSPCEECAALEIVAIISPLTSTFAAQFEPKTCPLFEFECSVRVSERIQVRISFRLTYWLRVFLGKIQK